jgi:hypothetical protein
LSHVAWSPSLILRGLVAVSCCLCKPRVGIAGVVHQVSVQKIKDGESQVFDWVTFGEAILSDIVSGICK